MISWPHEGQESLHSPLDLGMILFSSIPKVKQPHWPRDASSAKALDTAMAERSTDILLPQESMLGKKNAIDIVGNSFLAYWMIYKIYNMD